MKTLLQNLLCFCAILNIFTFSSYAQTLPSNFQYDWHQAGLEDTFSSSITLNILNFGADSSGVTPSDSALSAAINSLSTQSKTIFFPAGTYLFQSPILLPAYTILEGAGSNQSFLKFDLNGSDHAIEIKGNFSNIATSLKQPASKKDTVIYLTSTMDYQINEVIKIQLNDSDWVVSQTLNRTVGQIVRIIGKTDTSLTLNHPLRLDYPLYRRPVIQKMEPVRNSGIRCLNITREDATSAQTHTIYFNKAYNCFASGLVMQKANFAHIAISYSSHISVEGSYFLDAHNYGEGGKGYGVLCQLTSGDCLIENNVFEHLRHSMLLQLGANGNVFGYNYSIDPYWDQAPLPQDAAGDMVLHGYYPYANLFEGNIGNNIVIDDSHGINGPHNLFFRNQAKLYGIFMNNNPPTDSQAFIGNEIVKTTDPYGLYILFGQGHFTYGNWVRTAIQPANTEQLPDSSYYLKTKPSFLTDFPWPSIGTPYPINSGIIPAKYRYDANVLTTCGGTIPDPPLGVLQPEGKSFQPILYPNPNPGNFRLKWDSNTISKVVVRIWNPLGKLIIEKKVANNEQINLQNLPNGHYWIGVSTGEARPYFSTFIIER